MRHLTFIIFYVIVMLIFGVTTQIFYQENFEQPVSVDDMRPPTKEKKSWWEGLLDTIVGIGQAIAGIGGFLWRMLTFEIPSIPSMLRVLIVTPLHVAMAFVIVSLIRGGGN